MSSKSLILAEELYRDLPRGMSTFLESMTQVIESPIEMHLFKTKSIGNRFIQWLYRCISRTKAYINKFLSELLEEFSSLFSPIREFSGKSIKKHVLKLKLLKEKFLELFSSEFVGFLWFEISKFFQQKREKENRKPLSKRHDVRAALGITDAFDRFIDDEITKNDAIFFAPVDGGINTYEDQERIQGACPPEKSADPTKSLRLDFEEKFKKM